MAKDIITEIKDIVKAEIEENRDSFRGEQGDSPTDGELSSLIKPLIPNSIKGDDGKTPTKKELLELIKPLIPKVTDGEDGDTPTKDELIELIKPLIPNPIAGNDGDTPTEEELIELIRPLIPRPTPPRVFGGQLTKPQKFELVKVTASTFNSTAKIGMQVILCDCTSNNIIVNLRTASGNNAKLYIKKIDGSGNFVTVDGSGSETIDGSTTKIINNRYDTMEIVSDGLNWHII